MVAIEAKVFVFYLWRGLKCVQLAQNVSDTCNIQKILQIHKPKSDFQSSKTRNRTNNTEWKKKLINYE
jgi:hypothetical protein